MSQGHPEQSRRSIKYFYLNVDTSIRQQAGQERRPAPMPNRTLSGLPVFLLDSEVESQERHDKTAEALIRVPVQMSQLSRR